MDDTKAVAAWLRQREGETDAAWIARLHAAFTADDALVDDPKADRIGERFWARFQARLKAEENGRLSCATRSVLTPDLPFDPARAISAKSSGKKP